MVGVILVAAVPVVWEPLLRLYHPEDLAALGLALIATAFALGVAGCAGRRTCLGSQWHRNILRYWSSLRCLWWLPGALAGSWSARRPLSSLHSRLRSLSQPQEGHCTPSSSEQVTPSPTVDDPAGSQECEVPHSSSVPRAPDPRGHGPRVVGVSASGYFGSPTSRPRLPPCNHVEHANRLRGRTLRIQVHGP